MKNLIAPHRVQLGFSFIPQRNEKSNNQFLNIGNKRYFFYKNKQNNIHINGPI